MWLIKILQTLHHLNQEPTNQLLIHFTLQEEDFLVIGCDTCTHFQWVMEWRVGLKVGATLYKSFLSRVPLQTQIRQWKWHPLLWITLLCLFQFHSTRCMGFRCSRYFKFERTRLSLNMIQKRFRITLSQFASRVLPVVYLSFYLSTNK